MWIFKKIVVKFSIYVFILKKLAGASKVCKFKINALLKQNKHDYCQITKSNVLQNPLKISFLLRTGGSESTSPQIFCLKF